MVLTTFPCEAFVVSLDNAYGTAANRRSGLNCVKGPPALELNHTRRERSVALNTDALSACVMFVSVVSPSKMLNKPLLTVSETAFVGAPPPVDVLSFDQYEVLPAAFTTANLKYPVPLYEEPFTVTCPW